MLLQHADSGRPSPACRHPLVSPWRAPPDENFVVDIWNELIFHRLFSVPHCREDYCQERSSHKKKSGGMRSGAPEGLSPWNIKLKILAMVSRSFSGCGKGPHPVETANPPSSTSTKRWTVSWKNIGLTTLRWETAHHMPIFGGLNGVSTPQAGYQNCTVSCSHSSLNGIVLHPEKSVKTIEPFYEAFKPTTVTGSCSTACRP
jgi:hypothetical protein